MEDAEISEELNDEVSVFGVFDGHGGIKLTIKINNFRKRGFYFCKSSFCWRIEKKWKF